MAVQDDPKFKKWEQASQELQKRQAFFDAAKVFSKKHPLRQHCKKKLDSNGCLGSSHRAPSRGAVLDASATHGLSVGFALGEPSPWPYGQ